jgi:hypothetical protein
MREFMAISLAEEYEVFNIREPPKKFPAAPCVSCRYVARRCKIAASADMANRDINNQQTAFASSAAATEEP